MHNLCCFDGAIVSADKAHLNAASACSLYGKGVFTTLAIYNRKPFLWNKHAKRLFDNAAKLGISTDAVSPDSILSSLLLLIEKNSIVNGRARITLFDQSASSLWPYEGSQATSLLITTADLSSRQSELRLTVSPYRLNSTSPLAGSKSCNYLENLFALEEMKSRSFHEAVRLNERGEVTSACMS